MTEMMSGVEHAEEPKPVARLDGLDEQLVEQLTWCGPRLVGCG